MIISEGYQVGTIIRNPYDSGIKLSNVVIYFEKFPPGAVIRLRIKEVTNEFIGEDIFYGGIQKSLTKKRTVFHLQDSNIYIKGNSFFIGIDFLFNGEKVFKNHLNSKLHVRITDGFENPMMYTNYRDSKNNWTLFPIRTWPSSNPPNLQISAEVLVRPKRK